MWRRGDTKLICAWYTKSFSAEVAWTQRHGLRWQETAYGQPRQGLTHWTFKWGMEDWTCAEISSAWEWLRTGTRFPQKWKDWERVRFSKEPTNSWELTSCAAPNGEERELTRQECEQPGADVPWEALPGPWGPTSQVNKKVSKQSGPGPCMSSAFYVICSRCTYRRHSCTSLLTAVVVCTAGWSEKHSKLFRRT